MHEWMNGWMDKWLHWMTEYTKGWIRIWMNGRINGCMCVYSARRTEGQAVECCLGSDMDAITHGVRGINGKCLGIYSDCYRRCVFQLCYTWSLKKPRWDYTTNIRLFHRRNLEGGICPQPPLVYFQPRNNFLVTEFTNGKQKTHKKIKW